MANTAGTGLFAFGPARCDALSEVLAERWWAVGLRGILAIIFGLLCLLTPGIAIGALVLLFAAYMLVDGVFAIISGIRAARSGERWGLLILEGLVDLAAGAIAVIWPAITLVALVWIVAIWAIVSGALMLAAAFALNRDYGRWLLALGGIASLVFGILLIIEPLIGEARSCLLEDKHCDTKNETTDPYYSICQSPCLKRSISHCVSKE